MKRLLEDVVQQNEKESNEERDMGFERKNSPGYTMKGNAREHLVGGLERNCSELEQEIFQVERIWRKKERKKEFGRQRI